MKATQMIAPALAAILATACASTTHTASAPERAQQAEEDKERAQDEARDAKRHADVERQEAQDATRAQREAEENAQWEAKRAAQAERDAHPVAVAPAPVGPAPVAPAAGVTERQDNGTTVVVPNGAVSFATSSSDLTADSKAKLDEVARNMRAHPTRTVIVEGYADDTGNTANDAKLSRKRADAVAAYLEHDGISSDRIVVKGFGAHKVVNTEPPNRDRTLNRRVDVVFQPER